MASRSKTRQIAVPKGVGVVVIPHADTTPVELGRQLSRFGKDANPKSLKKAISGPRYIPVTQDTSPATQAKVRRNFHRIAQVVTA